MSSTVLILGSTGMLGQALIKEGTLRPYSKVVGMADTNAEYCCDIRDNAALARLLTNCAPQVIINTVGLVSLSTCEQNPALSYLINTRSLSVLAEYCKKSGTYLIHISTDHFYAGDGNRPHSEGEKVVLLNEYARTKYMAEHLALLCENSLVVRTNIVGFRHRQGTPTFVEWAIKMLREKKEMTLFSDFYTSSIDVRTLSKVLFDFIETKQPTGLLNVASREVVSKEMFVKKLANRLGLGLEKVRSGSVFDFKHPIDVKRAESLGLDVTKAETMLHYPLPTLDMVIESIALEYAELENEI